MKQTIKQHVGNFHLYLLAGLILLFFGVLFLSTAFKDISMSYEFPEQVISSELTDLEVGTIKLTNNGPITAKIKLKKLVACDDSTTIDLRYASKNIGRYSYTNSPSLELGSKKSDEVKLLASKYSFEYKYSNNSNFNLYIYVIEADDYEYGYCATANKEDAYAMIKIQITEKETTKEEIIVTNE